MKKKQILNYSISLSILIALFVVFTVVITTSGRAEEEVQFASLKLDQNQINLSP